MHNRTFMAIAGLPLAACWIAFVLGIGSVAQIATATPAEAQSVRFCENYARDYANRRARRGVARGTARGAGAGAIIGGIANGGRGAGRGAAIGAGVGLIAGSGARGNNFDFYYNRAFTQCMRG